MARRRASMREGPLAELFRATEAAQRQSEGGGPEGGEQPPTQETAQVAIPEPEPEERTVEHVPSWEAASRPPQAELPLPAPPSPAPPPPSPGPDPAPPTP